MQAALSQRNRALKTTLGPLRAEREGLERHISALDATSVALDSWCAGDRIRIVPARASWLQRSGSEETRARHRRLMENEGRIPETVDVDAAFQVRSGGVR